MTNKQFIAKLKRLNACPDAVKWVRKKDLKTAWTECERADWMLWLMCRMEFATQQERIHTICDCAETSLKYISEGEERPRKAIEATRKYADNPTKENRIAALEGAEAAWVTEEEATVSWESKTLIWTSRASAWAVWAALKIIEIIEITEITTTSAEAAAKVAVEASKVSTWPSAHKRMCKMIRTKIKITPTTRSKG